MAVMKSCTCKAWNFEDLVTPTDLLIKFSLGDIQVKLTVLCNFCLCKNGLTASLCFAERSITFTLAFNHCRTFFKNGSCKINIYFWLGAVQFSSNS